MKAKLLFISLFVAAILIGTLVFPIFETTQVTSDVESKALCHRLQISLLRLSDLELSVEETARQIQVRSLNEFDIECALIAYREKANTHWLLVPIGSWGLESDFAFEVINSKTGKIVSNPFLNMKGS